jgi:hypothetical protein
MRVITVVWNSSTNDTALDATAHRKVDLEWLDRAPGTLPPGPIQGNTAPRFHLKVDSA